MLRRGAILMLLDYAVLALAHLHCNTKSDSADNTPTSLSSNLATNKTP